MRRQIRFSIERSAEMEERKLLKKSSRDFHEKLIFWQSYDSKQNIKKSENGAADFLWKFDSKDFSVGCDVTIKHIPASPTITALTFMSHVWWTNASKFCLLKLAS